MEPEKKEIWTTGEIAEKLGCHEMTVRRWIAKGLLKAFQPCKRAPYRVKKAELERFMEERHLSS